MKIFVNISRIFLGVLIALPILFTMDVEAATFRCTAKPVVYRDGNRTGENIVRVTIKGDGVTSTQFSTAKISSPTKTSEAPPVTPTTSGTIVTFSVQAAYYIQGEQMSIYAYKPFTQELIEEVANCKYAWNRTPTASAPTTTTPAPSTQVTPQLPFEFVTAKTVTTANKINLTVKNNSTNVFNTKILAKVASSGSVVATLESVVPGNSEKSFEFYTGITAGETYNFVLTGTQTGSTKTYAALSYDGVIATANQPSTPSGGGGTGNNQNNQPTTDNQTTATKQGGTVGDGTCNDGKDNDGDKRMDWKGGILNGNLLPPDPSCINEDQTEIADEQTGSAFPLIPCVNKCDLSSVFLLMNNVISFFIKVILFPISILLFVYAGYTYITAQGIPAKRANVKKMVRNLIFGVLIILTAWVVVRTGLKIIGYEERLFFFEE